VRTRSGATTFKNNIIEVSGYDATSHEQLIYVEDGSGPVTSDYNQTPIAGLGFPNDPTFLWTQPTPGVLPQLPVYMAQVNDPWAPGTACFSGAAGQACYQFNEVDSTGGGNPGPANVVYSSWSAGADAIPVAWDGIGAIGADDLGNSTVLGCAFGLAVPISNPC